uniref:Uncharacterized protein n=1 Tax=Kalanchoe fedtschenkoi TaxID=63787 RepID=A0A7N0UCW9_KALFE
MSCYFTVLKQLPSPPFVTSNSAHHHVFNPFLEPSTDAEISKIKVSPPPKFKFLQGAEEKFYRRKMLAEEDDGEYGNRKPPTVTQNSFICIVIGKHRSDKAQ